MIELDPLAELQALYRQRLTPRSLWLRPTVIETAVVRVGRFAFEGWALYEQSLRNISASRADLCVCEHRLDDHYRFSGCAICGCHDFQKKGAVIREWKYIGRFFSRVGARRKAKRGLTFGPVLSGGMSPGPTIGKPTTPPPKPSDAASSARPRP